MAQTQQRQRCQWKRWLIRSGVFLSCFGVGTAAASLLPGGPGQGWQDWAMKNYPNPLAQILEQVGQSAPIVETILGKALGTQWDKLKTTAGSEQPNPYQVRTAESSTGAGVLTMSPIIRQRDLANLYDQEIARSMSALLLGEEGQKRLESETERTSGLVESSQAGTQQAQQLAQEAQNLGVTQDVMKQNARIQAQIASLLNEQTQLTADNHTALLQLQQLQGMLTQLAANTSEGIDETNRRARLERQVSISGSAQAPIYIPGALGTSTPAAE
jgi:hypothetical protein